MKAQNGNGFGYTQTTIMRKRRLQGMSKKELQVLCKEYGIPTSNNNIDMRNRLFQKGA